MLASPSVETAAPCSNERFYHHEKIGLVPTGWKVGRLKEFCVLQRGHDLTDNDAEPGPFPVVKSNGIDGCHAEWIAEPPGVVTGRSGTIGNVFYIEERFWPHNTALYVKDFRDSHPRFIFYLIQRLRFDCHFAGTTIPTLNRNDVHKLWVTVPADTREQIAIAEALALADSAIVAGQQSIAKAERLQKGLMQQLLTGRLKPDGTPRRDSDFKEDDHFGSLPRRWQSARVKNLIASCEYGLSRAMSEHGQYPIFRMNNIERGRMVAAPLAYIDLSPDDFARYRVRRGDILFNRTNTVELVGKVGIFALEGDFVFASYLVRLVANDENDPRFLNYYLNSFEGQKRIAAKVTPSIGQANINTRSLKSVWAVKPPRDEQSAIADRLDAFFELVTAKEQKIAALQRLKKSLMQNLLTGRIRLPVAAAPKAQPFASPGQRPGNTPQKPTQP